MYELLGCSTHYGVPNKGDGLTECVRTLNQRLLDHPIREIPEQTLPEENLPNLKYLNSVAATCWDIAAAVDEIKRRGNTPLFIGRRSLRRHRIDLRRRGNRKPLGTFMD